MERLTKRLDSGEAVYHLYGFEAFDEIEAFGECVDHLAAYEDTGLSPKTVSDLLERFDYFYRTVEGLDLVDPVHFGAFVDRVKCWQQAEKDGRLVVLPCKVGDEVWTNFAMSGWYFRDKDKPYSARVVFIGLNGSDAMGRGLINVVYGKHDYMTQFSLSDIGKSVFLTREEAEAALKKREADNEAD